jgi:hypothetical protein
VQFISSNSNKTISWRSNVLEILISFRKHDGCFGLLLGELKFLISFPMLSSSILIHLRRRLCVTKANLAWPNRSKCYFHLLSCKYFNVWCFSFSGVLDQAFHRPGAFSHFPRLVRACSLGPSSFFALKTIPTPHHDVYLAIRLWKLRVCCISAHVEVLVWFRGDFA